jgi:transcription antitermination factor NusG
MRDVQVSSIQGPSLPKKDHVHPLVGHRVKVTRGNFKGYRALVKDVSTSSVIIEVEAKVVGMNAPYVHIQWADFRIV